MYLLLMNLKHEYGKFLVLESLLHLIRH